MSLSFCNAHIESYRTSMKIRSDHTMLSRSQSLRNRKSSLSNVQAQPAFIGMASTRHASTPLLSRKPTAEPSATTPLADVSACSNAGHGCERKTVSSFTFARLVSSVSQTMGELDTAHDPSLLKRSAQRHMWLKLQEHILLSQNPSHMLRQPVP
eukprot:m.125540 g.125540  ORF g.125540 m.125540 type:complete len:154 (-) comp13803_c0_seq1:156-617(-)